MSGAPGVGRGELGWGEGHVPRLCASPGPGGQKETPGRGRRDTDPPPAQGLLAARRQKTATRDPSLHRNVGTRTTRRERARAARSSQNTLSLHSGVILEKPPGCCEGHPEVPPPVCPPPGPRPTHPCAVGTAHPWRPSWRHPPSLGPRSRSLFSKMLPHQEMRNSSGRRECEQGRSSRAADSAASRARSPGVAARPEGPAQQRKITPGQGGGLSPTATAPSRIRTQERRGPPPA